MTQPRKGDPLVIILALVLLVGMIITAVQSHHEYHLRSPGCPVGTQMTGDAAHPCGPISAP